MENKETTKPGPKKKEPTDIVTPVSRATLHSSVFFDGKEGTTLDVIKMPTIKAMGWTENFSAFVIHAGKKKAVFCVLPSAAIRQSNID